MKLSDDDHDWRIMANSFQQLFSRSAPMMLQVAVFLVLIVAWSGSAVAAGCHYIDGPRTVFEGGKDGRYAHLYMWTTGPLIRVYEGGQFRYYQAPNDGKPCDGPNCRPSRNEGSVSPPAVSDVHRLSMDASGNGLGFDAKRQGSGIHGYPEPLLVSPAQEVPLRPPCQIA